MLEEFCILHGVKMIHGGVGGNFGQVSVSSKLNPIVQKLNGHYHGAEKDMGNIFPVVSMIASMQIKLAMNVILEKQYLKNGFYYLEMSEFNILKIAIEK